jgi:hypothetical protein
MPEIRNEVPTDDELRVYLLESLAVSSITMLARYPDKEQQWQPEMAEALSYLSVNGSTFLTVMTDTIFQASKRLNQLSREDPFWRNTNRRPTIYKLPEHCGEILRDDPNDVLSLLTIVVLDVARSGEFRSELWSRLNRLQAVSMEFIAFAAMLLWLSGGVGAEAFCMFVKDTGSMAEAEPILRRVSANGGKVLAEWSDSVMGLVR